jgi:hypothetical protein
MAKNENKIRTATISLAPRPGATVSLRHVREMVDMTDTDFDAAVASVASDRDVTVTRNTIRIVS